jgi:hypothetical protein
LKNSDRGGPRHFVLPLMNAMLHTSIFPLLD